MMHRLLVHSAFEIWPAKALSYVAAMVFFFFSLDPVSAGDAMCGADLATGTEAGGKGPTTNSAFYEFEVKSIDGAAVKLATYRGNVLMIVNTASRCGFTSQYKDLQELYAKYQEKGFVVLAFPSNDFLSQEPGSNKEIKDFCETNFNTKFPIFEKGSVKGEGIQPLFRYLTADANSKMTGAVAWNFEKFVIDRNGQLVGRFKSGVKPSANEVRKLIESSLSEKATANDKATAKEKDSKKCS